VISLARIRAMELLATDPLLPARIVAGIAFLAMICAYVYVLRHLQKIEKTIVADNLVPSALGARNKHGAPGLYDTARHHRAAPAEDGLRDKRINDSPLQETSPCLVRH
jgi:hypothetical protein